jgi:hypothetical protein
MLQQQQQQQSSQIPTHPNHLQSQQPLQSLQYLHHHHHHHSMMNNKDNILLDHSQSLLVNNVSDNNQIIGKNIKNESFDYYPLHHSSTTPGSTAAAVSSNMNKIGYYYPHTDSTGSSLNQQLHLQASNDSGMIYPIKNNQTLFNSVNHNQVNYF